MDGSSTPRSDMAGKLARFANSHPDIWKSRPIQGDIGIVFVPESQIFNYVQRGNTDFYAHSARGAYQAFFDSNIQADFVHIDDIKTYPVVYLPYPVMLKQETVRKLTEYVEQGGILISEGTPAYFGDRGKAGTVQPNLGLDKVFGARESYVEFTPDLLENLTLRVRGARIDGALFRQEYASAGGTVVGRYENGKPAAIENQVGKGKTLLIGTFPGAGYYRHHSPEARAFYAGLLEWAQREQQVRTDDPDVKVRLHTGAGGTYLWAVNPTRTERTVTVTLAPKFGTFSGAQDLWQERAQAVKGRTIVVRVGDRDAAIMQLN
jgi:beta-galactosidase